MDVRCDKCQARYRIDDARVGPAGLTMRCGKCSNTFKVTRAPAAADPAATLPSQAPVAPAPKKPAAAKPADAGAGATMMFAGPPKAAAAAKQPDDGGANATMVFGAAAPAAAKPEPKKAAPPADNESGATMVFGQSPVAKPATAPAMPKPASKAAPADGAGATLMFGAGAPRPAAPARPAPAAAADGAGATLMFGSGPAAGAAKPTLPPPARPPPPPPAPLKAAPAPEPEPAPQTDPEQAAAEPPAEEPEPAQARAGESVGDDDVDPAAHTGEDPNAPSVQSDDVSEEAAPEGDDGMLAKGPPRGLLIGVGALVGVLLVALVSVVAVKKLGAKPPPDSALQALQQGQALADKDSVALYQTALETTKAALAAAPKSPFGEAHATEAEIEVAWADALADLATIWTDKGTAAQNAGDDKKKAEADSKVTDFQTQAKAHLKAALEAAASGSKADPKSPDLSIALADYYRANHASSNMNKELKRAGTLSADPARIALVQGIALSADEDTAEKAVGKLKDALKAMPTSARAHYRLAQALLAQHKDADALLELKETLKLSPSHERAKAQLEVLAPPPAPPEAAPTPAPAAPAPAPGK